MIFFLNKGLILEQVIIKSIQDYFNVVGIPEFYKGFTVNVTNKHPFARLLLNSITGEKPSASLFPAVVVSTLEDGKPGELADLVDTSFLELMPEDVNAPEGGKSPMEAREYMMMTTKKLDAIRLAVAEKGHVYGISNFIRRQDRISIEIWAENIQLKNELYEAIRLFVCGWMKESLEKLYEENGFALFDNTVRGQRSNNANVDFGIELWGAYITFEADYTIEQTVIDTELVDSNIDFMEVINHVKGQAGTTRSVIIGGGDSAESGGSEP
ncbi:hypothetical protein AGMMS49944_19710 [Spirochaetia bacterium]|nr:hypothetical protein AGMMS49944_19710 [Spirochaetia bacterium]